MGNHQCQVTVLVPGKKLAYFDNLNFFPLDQNDVAYHPGPALPPSADGSLLGSFDEKYLRPYSQNG